MIQVWFKLWLSSLCRFLSLFWHFPSQIGTAANYSKILWAECKQALNCRLPAGSRLAFYTRIKDDVQKINCCGERLFSFCPKRFGFIFVWKSDKYFRAFGSWQTYRQTDRWFYFASVYLHFARQLFPVCPTCHICDLAYFIALSKALVNWNWTETHFLQYILVGCDML